MSKKESKRRHVSDEKDLNMSQDIKYMSQDIKSKRGTVGVRCGSLSSRNNDDIDIKRRTATGGYRLKQSIRLLDHYQMQRVLGNEGVEWCNWGQFYNKHKDNHTTKNDGATSISPQYNYNIDTDTVMLPLSHLKKMIEIREKEIKILKVMVTEHKDNENSLANDNKELDSRRDDTSYDLPARTKRRRMCIDTLDLRVMPLDSAIECYQSEVASVYDNVLRRDAEAELAKDALDKVNSTYRPMIRNRHMSTELSQVNIATRKHTHTHTHTHT
eukprot:GHVR01125056.1.p1 GENE.GHVR01125056.1~~GHVR01125056.1.p1  ORF type:complete len:279 (-),score=91.18 GHVR01125056.1:430-1242(-)